jgi:Protein of unknown function (DUF2752)
MWYKILIAIASMLAVAIYFQFDPAITTNNFPKCPLYSFTHLYCTGCGSQRAFHQILHGNFIQATHYNVMAVIFLPYILLKYLIDLVNYLFKKSISLSFYSNQKVNISILVVFIIFTVLRNIPLYPFNLLAPHK